jgi:hypothetical protein
VGKLDSAEKADITNIIGYGCVRIYVCTYVCMYVCIVCIYIYIEREREREIERETYRRAKWNLNDYYSLLRLHV